MDIFMLRALDLARQGEGYTSPNPCVGAVVVRDGQIVGEGFHPAAGEPHAEIFALREAGERARGATLYVTLEPCCHHGRTGPCCTAIVAAGIARVVAAVVDPNPRVAGQGLAQLRQSGIDVEIGLCAAEGRWLIAPFAKHILTGLPHVTLKGGMTLDGQLATANGQSQWITGSEARAFAHRLRQRCDAVMVGIGTVLADNPRLTTRLPGGGGRDPLRVVVDSRLRTPSTAALLDRTSPAGTVIATSESAPFAEEERLRATGAEVLRLPTREGRLDLRHLLSHLGGRGVQSLLLEGGGRLNHAAWREGLVDRLALFVAPLLLGGQGIPLFSGPGCGELASAVRLADFRCTRLGDDVLLEGEVAACSPD